MSRPLRLVIDTDGGTDDAVAIWWALTDPAVELLALIATWGNVARDVAAANCNRILTAAGRSDIPVALGAEGPMGGTPVPAGAGVAIHGEDELGGHAASWPVSDLAPIEEPANIFLSRLITEQPGEVALAVIGPLSTLAGALQADAALASRVGDLAVMGGAVARSGNVLPVGEVNIANDPEAAAAAARRAGRHSRCVTRAPLPRPRRRRPYAGGAHAGRSVGRVLRGQWRHTSRYVPVSRPTRRTRVSRAVRRARRSRSSGRH